MIRQNNNSAQLATWCCVYKSELVRKKLEAKSVKEFNRKLKKDLETTKSLLSERMSELTSCKELVKCLEDDVTGQDQQITSLKKKIEALQVATKTITLVIVMITKQTFNSNFSISFRHWIIIVLPTEVLLKII